MHHQRRLNDAICLHKDKSIMFITKYLCDRTRIYSITRGCGWKHLIKWPMFKCDAATVHVHVHCQFWYTLCICLGLLCFVSPLHKFRIIPCHRFVNLRQNQLKCIIPLKTKLNFGSVNFFLNFIKFTNKLDTWYTKPITGSVADWYWWCIAACARVAVQNDMRQAQ